MVHTHTLMYKHVQENSHTLTQTNTHSAAIEDKVRSPFMGVENKAKDSVLDKQ